MFALSRLSKGMRLACYPEPCWLSCHTSYLPNSLFAPVSGPSGNDQAPNENSARERKGADKVSQRYGARRPRDGRARAPEEEVIPYPQKEVEQLTLLLRRVIGYRHRQCARAERENRSWFQAK